MENSYKLLLLYSPMANGKWQVTCPVLTELAFEADAWSVVLLGMGIVVRGIMRRIERRPGPFITGAA